LKLQASIKYESNDLVGCKALIDDCSADDPDTMVNQACFLFKVHIIIQIIDRVYVCYYFFFFFFFNFFKNYIKK